MHLESITIKNYRKFSSTDNTVCFVKPESIEIKGEDDEATSVIAPSTTLIIGKNNSGKTTIVNALKMLCRNEQPSSSDFNLSYLHDLFESYRSEYEANKLSQIQDLDTPELEFNLVVQVDFKEADLMTYLAPFIPISERGCDKPVCVNIKIKVILNEEAKFKEQVKNIFKNSELSSEYSNCFEKFYELLLKHKNLDQESRNIFKTVFIDSNGEEKEKFSLNKLINIKEIKANRHLKEDVLSNVFNKIVSFQFSHDKTSRNDLEKSIKTINEKITGNVNSKSDDISKVLTQIENNNHIDISLSGNVTYEALIKGLIKYNFLDEGDYIPEDQFGLGYINLLNIIGEIIHFVDSYEEQSYLSYINLLFIEEPEVFMHPQMQEFFIKRIDKAVIRALNIASSNAENKKLLQCQIAITTHSSHIVNSKIHSSNTFNNINFLTSDNKCTKVVNLTDESVVTGSDEKALNFLKKHIKYKVSELFFSDAIIFVEGITEETLLNYYLENHPELSNYYISVFNINGAHGKIYLPLAKQISIPSLIITDLDIKRERCEKNKKHNSEDKCFECGYGIVYKSMLTNSYTVYNKVSFLKQPSFKQITSLSNRKTTNSTIKFLNKEILGKEEAVKDNISSINFIESDNVYIVFQKDPIEGQYATSLEEALILTNYDNDIVNEAIKDCKPKVYEKVLSSNNITNPRKNLIYNSYKLQKILSDSKSEFSNKLIFAILSEEDKEKLPILPDYIIAGLTWLAKKLDLKEKEIATNDE